MEAIKMSTIGVGANSTESTQLEQAVATETPTDTANGSTDTTETTENTQETEATAEQTVTQEAVHTGNVRKVVSYVAGGIWIDEKSKKWSREDIVGTDIKSTREYSEAEYNDRRDIRFMVDYGAMKVITVGL